jgi:hypothetical protein
MRPNSRAESRRSRRALLPALLFAIALACILSPAAIERAKAREDIAGWDQTRWGMTAAAIDPLYAPKIRPVDPPIDYGPSQATRVLQGLDFAGFAWRALLQFDREKQGLLQVMLERGRLPYAPKAFEAAMAELEALYGAPDLICDSPKSGASAQYRERVWRLATTSIHLVFLDIGGGELQYNVLDWPPNPLEQAWPQRFHGRGSYPQRLLIRYHPTARTDLFLPGCGR